MKKYTSNVTSDPILSEIQSPKIAPSTAGMTTKVVKGSLWTISGQIAPLAVSLVTTPFVIRMLGAEGYGVLILITLIPGYLGFADFGMSMASTKFASEAFAAGDTEREAQIVRTSALIVLAFSVPIAAAMFLFSSSIIQLFNVSMSLQSDASLALKFASVTFVLAFLSNVFNTPQLTRLRMDLNTFVNSGFRILGLIAVPLVIYFVGGIAMASLVLMIVGILTLAGHLFVSGNLLKDLFYITIDRKALRPILKFGRNLVVAGIAASLLVNGEKGILAASVSAVALAHYSVAFTLASMMTMFCVSMIQSLLPAFSQLQSEAKREQLNSLYSLGIRISLIFAIPAVVFLSMIAKPFFAHWAGKEFGLESTVPFYVLLCGVVFNLIASFPYTIIMASGRTDIFAKLYWAELVFYLILVWVLASRFGALGAAIAWSIRVIFDAFCEFIIAKRLSGISFSSRGLLWFAAAAMIMMLPLAANFYLGELTISLIIGTFCCIAVYAVVIWKTMLEPNEISWFYQQINRRFVR